MHATEFEPDMKISVESIQKGEGCSYIVTARGHGERTQRVAVDTKDEIPDVAAGMIARWIRYCHELANSDDGRAIVAGDAVIGAETDTQ